MGMFDKPKTPDAPAPKKSASKKEEVAVKGIEHLAMIHALTKTLETLGGTIEAEVKTIALDRFMAHIAATGQRPESFRGTEGIASAMLSLGRKASTTALTEAAIDLLRANGIEPEKAIITAEMFGINPAYAGDKVLLGKVEKALAKIVPEDFIILQPEVSKFVSTEEMLNTAISRKLPVDVIRTMTTLSCSPKLAVTDIAKIIDFVSSLVVPAVGKPAAADQGDSAVVIKGLTAMAEKKGKVKIVKHAA